MRVNLARLCTIKIVILVNSKSLQNGAHSNLQGGEEQNPQDLAQQNLPCLQATNLRAHPN